MSNNYEETGGQLDQLNQKVSGLEEQLNALAESGVGGGEGGSHSGEGILDLENLAAALEPYLEVSGEIPDDVEASLARLQGAIEEHSVSLADAQNRLDALEQQIAALEEQTDRRSAEEIRQLIREYVDEHVQVNVDEDAIVERVVERVGTGGSDADLSNELEAIRRERKRFSLVGSPKHSRTIARGSHEDSGYHRHGSWGLVITPQKDVVWRGAKINAGAAGSTQLEVFDMDYVRGETYKVGDRLETHEVTVRRSGENTIHPDIVLEAGRTVFITRDTDLAAGAALPLKRAEEDVDWSSINDNDVPMTIHCSWQRGRGQPGTQAFQDYRDANWHRVLHYYRDMEFGFNEES